MSGFKSGDLALVVGCGLNSGRAVELVSFHANEIVTMPCGILRSTIPNGMSGWLVTAKQLNGFFADGRTVMTDFMVYEECSLMPLSGDFQPESQLDREVME